MGMDDRKDFFCLDVAARDQPSHGCSSGTLPVNRKLSLKSSLSGLVHTRLMQVTQVLLVAWQRDKISTAYHLCSTLVRVPRTHDLSPGSLPKTAVQFLNDSFCTPA